MSQTSNNIVPAVSQMRSTLASAFSGNVCTVPHLHCSYLTTAMLSPLPAAGFVPVFSKLVVNYYQRQVDAALRTQKDLIYSFLPPFCNRLIRDTFAHMN